MNSVELAELFTKALSKKLIGTVFCFNKRIILDTRVEICREEWRDNWGGGYRTNLEIQVQTASPAGRIKTWYNYEY